MKTILFCSGKGGTGKSTLAANLAVAAATTRKVGLLDLDTHGPTIPYLLGLNTKEINLTPKGELFIPVNVYGLKVFSLGLVFQNGKAIMFFDSAKYDVIHQCFSQVKWGNLDLLFIDCPPSLGIDLMATCEAASKHSESLGALVVAPPNLAATGTVERLIDALTVLGLPIVGIVENMSTQDMWGAGGILSDRYNLPLIARIWYSAKIARLCDEGRPFVLDEEYRNAMVGLAEKIISTNPTVLKKPVDPLRTLFTMGIQALLGPKGLLQFAEKVMKNLPEETKSELSIHKGKSMLLYISDKGIKKGYRWTGEKVEEVDLPLNQYHNLMELNSQTLAQIASGSLSLEDALRYQYIRVRGKSWLADLKRWEDGLKHLRR